MFEIYCTCNVSPFQGLEAYGNKLLSCLSLSHTHTYTHTMYTHTHACTKTHTHTHTHAHTHMHICTQTHIYLHTYEYTHTYTHTHTHTHHHFSPCTHKVERDENHKHWWGADSSVDQHYLEEGFEEDWVEDRQSKVNMPHVTWAVSPRLTTAGAFVIVTTWSWHSDNGSKCS